MASKPINADSPASVDSQRLPAAALWMIGALVSFMAMAIAGREASESLSTFQILFFRSLIGLMVITGLLSFRGCWHQVRTPTPGLQVIRNLAHFGGQFGWFYGIAYISLAEVFAIEFTVPIWTALAAWLLLGEQLTRGRILAIMLGFVGTLIILRPGTGLMDIAALAVLASALCYAIAHTLTKKMVADNSPMNILFYMTLIQLPLGLLPSLQQWHWPDAMGWLWLSIVGISALTAHYCISRAFQLADATVVVPLDFLRLPLIAVTGFLLYQEPLDPWLFLGASLILGGILLNLIRER